ncbi:unnamed protein product [Leptidea sinapis]|uniref:Uncharacterized protein n=2 Tax=Leptidea sinapis TaxID=189913 RepID=A0A5E4QVX5_9NEOP|nr:unnamed protein product [Leptidea sinapis]
MMSVFSESAPRDIKA